MVKQKDWFAEFKGKQKLSESEVNLLKRRLNDGKVDIQRVRKNGYALTKVQVEKGRKWLRSKCYTARGEIRESGNFGYREAEILDTMKTIRLEGFIDVSRYRQHPCYQPQYRVVGVYDDFEYYLSNGEIIIIG